MRRRGWALAALLAALLAPASAPASGDYLSHCNGNGFCAVVSQDGLRLVFPFNEELIAGAGEGQIYEWAAGAQRPLLPPRDRAQAPFYSNLLATSADGSHVFVQTGEPLSPEDRDGTGSDVYDLHEGAATLVSTGPLDTQAPSTPGAPEPLMMWFRGVSADGAHVYFDSDGKVVADDGDECSDVYERAAGVTSLLSAAPTAASEAASCDRATFRGVSADGSHVFIQTGEKLVPEDEGGDDIYERVGGAFRLLTTYPEPTQYPQPENCVDWIEFGDSSADGRTLLFATSTRVTPADTDNTNDVYKRLPDGSFTLVSRGTDLGPASPPCGGYPGDRAVALSADGRVAIFATRSALSPVDRDSSEDLYRDDGSSISLVSTGPTDPGVDEQLPPPPQRAVAVSDDAERVAFVSRAALVAEDKDNSDDVYLRTADRTLLISTGPGDGNMEKGAHLLGMSGDGRAIAFGTGEGLIPRDANGRADFYLWQEGRSQPTLITAETLAPRMRIAAHGRVRRDGRILVRLACPSAETRGPCRARVAIKRSRRGRALGRGTFEVGVGKRRWVAVRVRKRGPRPRRVVLVGVRGSDTLGNTAVVRRRVALAGIRSR